MKVNLFTSSSKGIRFIVKLICFVVIVIILDQFYGFITHKLFEAKLAKHIASQKIMECINYDPDILILGSSRASHHYVPDIIEQSTGLKCYNLGIDGSMSTYHRDLLRVILSEINLKVVVLDLSNNLSFNTTKGIYSYHNDLSILEHYLKDFPKEIYNYNKYEKYLHKIYFYKYNSLFSPLFNDALIHKNVKMIKGYRPLAGYDKLLNNPNSGSYNLKKYNANLFKAVTDLKSICEENKIKLIYATSPIYQNDEIIVPENFITWVRDNKQIYLNYTIPRYKQFNNNKLYKDINHLNKNGAENFTRLFVKELNEIFKEK